MPLPRLALEIYTVQMWRKHLRSMMLSEIICTRVSFALLLEYDSLRHLPSTQASKYDSKLLLQRTNYLL